MDNRTGGWRAPSDQHVDSHTDRRSWQAGNATERTAIY